MPPKKKSTAKKSGGGSKSGGDKGGGKKGGKKGKKGAKQEHEGPVDWKLSKDRLEMLKPDNLPVPSSIKARVTEDLEHLTAHFPHRHPLKHWTLKSNEIPLQGIAGEDAQGVLFSHAPAYPVVDVCDRRAVARCWRAIRCHFEPLGKPVGEESSDEEEDIFADADGGGFGDDDNNNSGGSGNGGGGGGGGGSVSSRPQTGAYPAYDDPNSCGALTLHGLSRWLNNRGERFPAPGFPYDEKVWKPLEVVILKHFRKSDGGQIRARWKQPAIMTPLFLPSISGAEGGGSSTSGGGGGGLMARRMMMMGDEPSSIISAGGGLGGSSSSSSAAASRAEVIRCVTAPAEVQKLKFEAPKPGQLCIADQVALAESRVAAAAATAAAAAAAAAEAALDTEGSSPLPDVGNGNGSSLIEPMSALLSPSDFTPLESTVEMFPGMTTEEVDALEALAHGPELARALSRHPASADSTDHKGDSALALAAGSGLSQAVFVLLRAGAFADNPGAGGDTALHKACEKGYVDCVKALLAGGCDAASQNACGESALHVASRQGHDEVVKLLLKEKSVLVSQYTQGAHHTAMHYAAGQGHVSILKQLDKAAAAEAKKLGGGAGGKKGKGAGKKGKKGKEGGGGDDGPVGSPVEPATINTLSSSLEPPLLRAVAALGGIGAVKQGDVLKEEGKAGLAGALSFCGGKFKNPLLGKGGGKKAGGEKKGGEKKGGDKKKKK